MMFYFKLMVVICSLMMVKCLLMMVKCSSMMVNWLYDHTHISPSLTCISPTLTSVLPSLAWSKPSFAHLNIFEKLHRLKGWYPDPSGSSNKKTLFLYFASSLCGEIFKPHWWWSNQSMHFFHGFHYSKFTVYYYLRPSSKLDMLSVTKKLIILSQ